MRREKRMVYFLSDRKENAKYYNMSQHHIGYKRRKEWWVNVGMWGE
jgi:hypothetical protein